MCCLLCCAVILGLTTVRAAGQEVDQPGEPEEKNVSERMVSVDFNDVDLTVFIKFISEITNRNFVIDEHMREKVTVISPSKISIEEAYQVFQSVLEVYGYTTVESGQVTKIVKSVDARTKSIATGLLDEAGETGDKVVTQIIPLTYADTEEVKQLLVPLISKTGVVLSYPSTNMLIVTDIASNIQRLQKIIKVIDVTGIGRQVTVIPLEYSDAAKMVSILEHVFQDQARGRKPESRGGIKLIADERANAVVVLAGQAELSQVRELIEMLDRKRPQGKERIHVYYLKNADAEELSEVLLNLPKDQPKEGAGASRTPVISKDVSITADSATNSLIIMADRDDYAVLKDIIEQLDIPRSMVYIECLIMEVNVDSDFSLGTEWMAMNDGTYDGKAGAYGGGFGGASEDRGYNNILGLVAPGNKAGLGTLPPGFSLGAFGEAIKIGDVVFPNLAAIIQAYEKNKDVNILSTPQIMTTNNPEASITVGKNIPYLTKIGTTSSTETYSNYEYKDVGISLKIKPQINENRLIRLDLTQEVTRLDTLTTVSMDRPATLKRTIETNVIVHDQHTIVIGGLIDDSMSSVEYRVPCLGDIPLLGWLFKGLSDAREKSNLFVFLTPRVIKTFDEAEAVVDDKEENIKRLKKGSRLEFSPGEEQRKPEDIESTPRSREEKEALQPPQPEKPNPGMTEPTGTVPEE
ncbi:MAG: type II secretion system secretin GspD [Desulfosudaceae bacterium]